MNTLSPRMFAAAALLTLAGTAAAAELTADVPFTFHTTNATMALGKYTVSTVATGAASYYRLRHESGKMVLVVLSNLAGARHEASQLTFQCAGEYCALKSIHPGSGSPGVDLQMRMKPQFRGERVAEVRVPATRK